MTIPGIDQSHSDKLLEIFKNMPPGCEIILFGSRAKGSFREGSDIDIAIKGVGLNLEVRDSLLANYENLFLPWKLDIVLYAFIQETALKEHIDRVGRLLKIT